MNSLIWILQGIMALIFMFSGINKSFYSEKTLVAKGQTGVEGLPLILIRFIGLSEILGAIGIIFPVLLNIYPTLTSIAAFCLAAIMIPAGYIHYKRKEYKNIFVNCTFLIICLVIAYFRMLKN